MKKNIWSAVAVFTLLAPLSAQATLIGTFEGKWADDPLSAPPTNFGTLQITFNSTTPNPGGFNVSALISFICIDSVDPDDCGISNATFTGTFATATNTLAMTFQGVNLFGTVSADFTSIQGGYNAFEGTDKVFGSYYVSRATSVPEPATLSLLLMGLAGIGAAQRRRAASVPAER